MFNECKRLIHVQPCLMVSRDDKRMMLRSLPKKDEGVQSYPLLSFGFGNICDLPDPDTLDKMYDGIPYSKLPRLYIVCTRNNTKLALWDHRNYCLARKSCLTEGYKNARKGTTVAAQAATTAMCKVLKLKEITTFRVCIRGLGPGRMASIQTLALSGLNVVSITDTTDYSPIAKQRPPAQRSL